MLVLLILTILWYFSDPLQFIVLYNVFSATMLSWHIGWKLQCVKYHLASGLILGTLIGPMHTRFKAVWSALLNQLTAECFNWVGWNMGRVAVVCSGLVCVGSMV